MYKLYERVDKSKEYMYGSKPIEESKNPFQEGPCLLCVSAQVDNAIASKSNFGISKQGMQMARLRVRGAENARFALKNFPVKFLSMQLDRKDEAIAMTQQERIEAFAKKYLIPLISNNCQRIGCTEAMKNMRNVNMMSYCDGTKVVQAIEEILIQEMQKLGYTDEECSKIQSQMCMFPISTNRLNGMQKSTCISFKDINDREVNNNVTAEERQTVQNSPLGEAVIEYSNNEIAYLVNGDGAHRLKKYSKEGGAMPVCLSSVISKALENSIENSSSTEFIPITAKLLTADLNNIMLRAVEGVTLSELMEELDNSLTYGGARRISEMEAQLLDQLDESYDGMIRVQRTLASTEQSLQIEREKSTKINKAINENCSKTTRLKILIAGGYQLGLGEGVTLEEVTNSLSDKELIANMEKKNPSALDGTNVNEHSQKAAKLQDSVEKSKQLSREIDVLESQQEKIN